MSRAWCREENNSQEVVCDGKADDVLIAGTLVNQGPHGTRGTVAVLGGSGFIGVHAVAALRAAGYSPRVLSRGKRPVDGGESVSLDVVTCPIPVLASALAGCVAVVNVVGIKRPKGPQTFEAVHDGLVRRLVEACKQAGVSRLVHVSVVAAAPDGPHPYHRTKWRAEQVVRGSGLQWTILRPSVVYGRGDDMLSHLAKMIRGSPVFPIVGRGAALLQPVDVEDVATAIVAAVERAEAVGRSYDVVGPDTLALREVVQLVAEACEERTTILSTPPALLRVPVFFMSLLAREPLSTPAQLRMLESGLTGDGLPMAEDLGVRPAPFTLSRIRDRLPPRAAPMFDLRLGRRGPSAVGLPVAVLAAFLGIAGMTAAFLLPWWDTWTRLVLVLVLLGGIAAGLAGQTLVGVWRVNRWTTALGLAAGAFFLAVSWLVARLPGAGGGLGEAFALRAGHPDWVIVVTLVPAIVGEELLWRGVMQTGLGSRMPQWLGILLATGIYASAHLAAGSALLLAACIGFGLAWGLMFAVTRSLWAVVVSHIAWEVATVAWQGLRP